MTTPADARREVRALMRRADKARNFPTNTCGASRHVQIIAEELASAGASHQLTDDPAHCAASMLAVVAELWECRTKLAARSA